MTGRCHLLGLVNPGNLGRPGVQSAESPAQFTKGGPWLHFPATILTGYAIISVNPGKVLALPQYGQVAFAHSSPSRWVRMERFTVTTTATFIADQLHGLPFNVGGDAPAALYTVQGQSHGPLA